MYRPLAKRYLFSIPWSKNPSTSRVPSYSLALELFCLTTFFFFQEHPPPEAAVNTGALGASWVKLGRFWVGFLDFSVHLAAPKFFRFSFHFQILAQWVSLVEERIKAQEIHWTKLSRFMTGRKTPPSVIAVQSVLFSERPLIFEPITLPETNSESTPEHRPSKKNSEPTLLIFLKKGINSSMDWQEYLGDLR